MAPRDACCKSAPHCLLTKKMLREHFLNSAARNASPALFACMAAVIDLIEVPIHARIASVARGNLTQPPKH